MDNTDTQPGEFTLTDLVLVIREYLRYLVRFWYLFIIAGLLLGAFFAWSARESLPTYPAALTFMVNEDVSGGGGMGSILGQFGLGGGGSEYNLDKMLHLAESQKMLFATLTDSVEVDGSTDLLGNHILGIYKLGEEWGYAEKGETPRLPHTSFDGYTRDDRKLILRLYRRLLGGEDGPLIATSSDGKTGILEISATTLNEELSLFLTERLYDHLSDFYILESTGSNRATIKRLKMKADSLGEVLNAKEYALAQSRDRSAGLIRQRDQVRQLQLQREVGMLTLAYGEVLQNLETASFALGNNTPFFQVVDAPFSPLPRVQADWRFALVGGLFLGPFLVALLLSTVKFIGDMKAKLDREITARES